MLLQSGACLADARDLIERRADAALGALYGHAPGTAALLKRAAGVLVFPDIEEIAFGSGGQYGEGVLFIGGQPKAYYATVGPQHGVDADQGPKAQVVLFMTRQALVDFRNTVRWEAGVHNRVSPLRLDSRGRVVAERAPGPVLGFTFAHRAGLLNHLKLAGNTINRIAR